MKKDKKLKLNSEIITRLGQNEIWGGASDTIGSGCTPGGGGGGVLIPWSNKPSCGLTCDTPERHCDFPTINDSCLSLCNGKCNDF